MITTANTLQTGGETGVQNDVGQAAMRQKMFTGFSIFLGIITAFQVSGLQIYFLMSGLLGGMTGFLLKQNGFRRLIGIRPIPSLKANERYSEVISGQRTLADIKRSDGKLSYQAPKPVKASSRPSNRRQLSGINLAPGVSVPLHLQVDVPKIDKTRPDRDVDFEEGAAGKPLKEKLDYYRRNYRASFMWRRMTNSIESMGKSMGYGGPKVSPAEAKRKKKAEDYEKERRRRFENRQ
jgi:YidC/Oxa1 family membrane protein insertase